VAGAAALSSPAPPDACSPRSTADGAPGPAVPTASGAEEAPEAAPGTDRSANPITSCCGAASGATAYRDFEALNPTAHAAVPAAEADGDSVDLGIATVLAAYGPLAGAADPDGPALTRACAGAGDSTAASCAPAARTRSGADQAASRVRPSVDMDIATVIGAFSTLHEAQRRSVGTIFSIHLAAEKPKEWRARSSNGRDLLYTRETVPGKIVVGRRQARRRSLEASPAVARLCRDDEAAME